MTWSLRSRVMLAAGIVLALALPFAYLLLAVLTRAWPRGACAPSPPAPRAPLAAQPPPRRAAPARARPQCR